MRETIANINEMKLYVSKVIIIENEIAKYTGLNTRHNLKIISSMIGTNIATSIKNRQ